MTSSPTTHSFPKHLKQGINDYYCTRCFQWFNDAYKLFLHAEVCHLLPDDIFQQLQSQTINKISLRSKGKECLECGVNFSTQADLDVHNRSNHIFSKSYKFPSGYKTLERGEDGFFTCPCGKKFRDAVIVSSHASDCPEHVIPHPWTCPCGSTFTTESGLKIHITRQGCEEDKITPMTWIPLQDRVGQTLVSHSSKPINQCSQCDKTFFNVNDVKTHVNLQHVDTSTVNLKQGPATFHRSQGFFSCPCGARSPDAGRFKFHVIHCLGIPKDHPAECNRCGATFRTITDLHQHQQAMSSCNPEEIL